jgi:hypothetical protein
MERSALPLREAMRVLLMLLSCHCPASPRGFFCCATLARRHDLSGHRISSGGARASGSAIRPSRFARGHAGTAPNPKLTSPPDHSIGAGHVVLAC